MTNAMPRHAAKPVVFLIFRLIPAFLLLFFPVLTALVLYFVRPGWLMQLFYRYTGIPEYTYSAFLDSVFLPRMIIETASRIWNSLSVSLSLAAFLACIAVLIQRIKHVTGYPTETRRKTVEYISFPLIALITGGFAWFHIPSLLLWGGAVSAGYILNFSSTTRKPPSRRSIPAFIAGAMTGIGQFLFPAHLLRVLAGFLFPSSSKVDKIAVLCGQALYCLVTLSVSTMVFLAFRPQTISPRAQLLFPGKDFYAVEIDPVGRLLFLSSKYPVNPWPCHRFQLDMLDLPSEPFTIPSFEIEDLVVDETRRKIYHVERFNKTLFCLDADSLNLIWQKQLPAHGDGTVGIEMDTNEQVLIILWENDFLFTLDLDAWTSRGRYVGKGANMLYDPDHRLIYCQLGPPNRIEAIDLHTLKTIAGIPGPAPDRMALSRKFDSLYVADALHAKIWVFSVPWLQPTARIGAQFGVRPLAVDDENEVLLAGGVLTGDIEIHGLPEGAIQQRHRVARLSRRIAVDPQNRHAFITGTHDGLFLLAY